MKYTILLLIFLVSTLYAIEKPPQREITKKITGKKTIYFLNKKKYYTFVKTENGFYLEIFFNSKKVYSIIKTKTLVNKLIHSSKYSFSEIYMTSKGIPDVISINTNGLKFMEQIIYKNNEYIPITQAKYLKMWKSSEFIRENEDI